MANTVTFCIINLRCKCCGKRRAQGFFYRHTLGLKSGTNTIRTCEICTNYRKYKDRYSYDEYEAIRLKAYEDALLKQKGKYRCLQCDDIFDESAKIKKNHQCPTCRREYRSKEAVKERLFRWNANSEVDYQRAKAERKLSQAMLRAVSQMSTSPAQWQKWAYQHWLSNASDKEVSTIFYNHGVLWLNPRLSDAERYRLRYKFDLEFNIKERLRRQIKKKARRDGVSELIRTALKRNGRSPKVEDLLGYTITDLKSHLENLFTPGMSWDKYKMGMIHIDHVRPQHLFDLADNEDWKRCWSLSNLQPLWAKDNLKKSGRYEEA